MNKKLLLDRIKENPFRGSIPALFLNKPGHVKKEKEEKEEEKKKKN